MHLARFPRVFLAHLPTPLERLDRLTAELGGPEIWIKRDDCTGLSTGGNKTRKLEYLIPEAIAGGYDTLVSIGGIQSNQTRQVAAVAAHLGIKCVLVQENWVNYSDAVYDRVGNIEMSRIMGAEVTLFSRSPGKEADARRLGADHIVISTDAICRSSRSFS